MFVYKKKSAISSKSRVFPFSRFTNSNIGDFSYIGLFAFVNNTSIGKYCSISMNFKSGLGIHPTSLASTSPIFYSKKYAIKSSFGFGRLKTVNEYKRVTIGHDVWIGADVIIMDGVKVGNGAIIAAKAVVTKDVPNYAVVAGVPAKCIKYRFSDEIISKLEALSWWDWSEEKIKKNKLFFTNDMTLDLIDQIND